MAKRRGQRREGEGLASSTSSCEIFRSPLSPFSLPLPLPLSLPLPSSLSVFSVYISIARGVDVDIDLSLNSDLFEPSDGGYSLQAKRKEWKRRGKRRDGDNEISPLSGCLLKVSCLVPFSFLYPFLFLYPFVPL